MEKPFGRGPPWPEEKEMTQRRGPQQQRGLWCIVKGKGGYNLKTKIHCMTGHRGEFRSQESWCGQWLVVITPVVDHTQSRFPEVYCKKCSKAIEEL